MNPPSKQPPLMLCATWFRAVSGVNNLPPDIAELQLRTIGIGPHFDALEIFGRKEARLVHGLGVSEDGTICVHVKREHLSELAELMQNKYKMIMHTFGMPNSVKVGFQNGCLTPCESPYAAMKMAAENFKP